MKISLIVCPEFLDEVNFMKEIYSPMLGAVGVWREGPDGVVRPPVATLKADGMNHGGMAMWFSKHPIQDRTLQFNYKGTPSGDEMKIDIVRADGQGAPMTCTAKRAK
jgi:hypothetical protein